MNIYLQILNSILLIAALTLALRTPRNLEKIRLKLLQLIQNTNAVTEARLGRIEARLARSEADQIRTPITPAPVTNTGTEAYRKFLEAQGIRQDSRAGLMNVIKDCHITFEKKDAPS